MNWSQSPCRVGDVAIAGTFRVSPSELASFHQAQARGAQLGHPGAPPVGLHSPVSAGGEVPAAHLVARSVRELCASSLVRGYRVEVGHIGRPRVLTTAVVGEPITTVATVRFRSGRGRTSHVTFSVELRRASGGILARYDVGLDLHRPPSESAERDLAAA